jgi:hypothetical protein
MTFSNKIAGAAFSAYAGLDIRQMPYWSQMRGVYLPGASAAETRKNRVAGGADATIVSTSSRPTHNVGHAVFNCASAGLDTNLPASQIAFSHIIVATQANRTYCGHGEPGGFQSLIWHNGAGTELSLLVNAADRVSLAFAQGSDFAFIAGTYDQANAKLYAHNGTSMLSATGAYAATTPVYATDFIIGNNGFNDADFKCALAITSNYVFSAGQLGEIHDWSQEFLALRNAAMLGA